MSSFRQLEQRYIVAEIALMEWNPMLDLIALVTTTGDVILHRLSWQKVWSIPSPGTKEEPVLVKALAWRPDGKVLAYVYDNGKVMLCDVENGKSIHIVDGHLGVTSMSWVEAAESDKPEEMPFYADRSSEYLQKIYGFSKNYGTVARQVEEIADEYKKMKGQKTLNILAMALRKAKIYLYSFGILPCGFLKIKIKDVDKDSEYKILSATLSKDFKLLTVMLEVKNNYGCIYYYRTYDITMFHKNQEELKVVALKYSQVSVLMSYLSSTVQSIKEAWENILQEIDTKLHKYAEEKRQNSDGSISDDFLELLMFGTPSVALEKFLLHDLAESGLKKFGHSIELSYSNIQKLVLKRLQNIATSLFYNLNDLRGMAMWQERFGALRLAEAETTEALNCVGSFLLKAVEIQQVIDNSMKNFKAFFRWMYAVILRLSDEPVPHELSRVTQQDLNFVAEFLKENFSEEWDENKKLTVKLERVAQYLVPEKLPYPAVTVDNPWHKFLANQKPPFNSNLLFPHYPDESLITLHAKITTSIGEIIKGPSKMLKDHVEMKGSYVLHASEAVSPRISHVSCSSTNYLYTAFTCGTPPTSCLYLIREAYKHNGIEAIGLTFTQLQSTQASSPEYLSYEILDVKFYDSETMTILLIELKDKEIVCPILLQLPLKPFTLKMKYLENGPDELVSNSIPIVNAGSLVEKFNFIRLDNVKASEIAVSGSRKVVCVLFASRRQVRLFEMDVEEEEEEEFETEDSIMKDASFLESDNNESIEQEKDISES